MTNHDPGPFLTRDPSLRHFARIRWLITLIPAGLFFSYEFALRDEFSGLPSGYGLLVVCLLVVAVSFALSHIFFRALETSHVQARARTQEVDALSALVQERERLGRELHDHLAQLVTSFLVRTDTVHQLVAADRRDDALAELERLRSMADDLYIDVRESITGLRARVTERGLQPELQDYVEEFRERYGIDVLVETENLPDHLPPLVGFQLFRIIQEAITNVRKHADAQRVWISLACPTSGVVSTTVRDDGSGFDPESSECSERRHFGLTTMRERATGLGGTLRVESQPGEGTQVIVIVPLPLTPAEDHNGSMARSSR